MSKMMDKMFNAILEGEGNYCQKLVGCFRAREWGTGVLPGHIRSVFQGLEYQDSG
jgi:hypothetical protein